MNKRNQILKSILAIILCIAFLWTGKKFIWNQKTDETDIPQETLPPVSEVTNLSSVSTEAIATVPTSATVLSADISAPAMSSDAAVVSATEPAVVSTTLPPAVTSAAPVVTSSTAAPATSTVSAATSTTAKAGSKVSTLPGMFPAPEGYFDDALFIGDSRMVGLASFAPIEGATYFATTGLSTYKLDSAKSEVAPTKGMTFQQTLASKRFGKVYIMLGINELGVDRARTKQNYTDLVTRIRNTYPSAIVYCLANLHVAHSRADKDKYVNNVQMNDLNSHFASLADNQTVFYLDVNPLFDAPDGYLKSELTSDGVHPYAKHYIPWREFLMKNVVLR